MEGGVRGSATEDLAVGHQAKWRSAGGVMAQQAQTDIVARRTVVPRKVSWSEPDWSPASRLEATTGSQTASPGVRLVRAARATRHPDGRAAGGGAALAPEPR